MIAAGAFVLWGVARPLVAFARSRLRRTHVRVLGHRTAVPSAVTADMLAAFAPLGEWIARAESFFADPDAHAAARRLRSVEVRDARVVAHEVRQLTLRCRATLGGTANRCDEFDVVLKYPTAVLVLWQRDAVVGSARVLTVQEHFPDRMQTYAALPFGTSVGGVVQGGTLQRLKAETGLSVQDARRVECVEMWCDPRSSVEAFEYYSAEVSCLEQLVDWQSDGDVGRIALTPIEQVLHVADPRCAAVLLHFERFFPDLNGAARDFSVVPWP